MEFQVSRLDHVQVAAPEGKEEDARAFYSGVLGMSEVEKPEPLKARGGVWFAFGDYQLHVGVEEPFFPAKKAHPAFAVEGYELLRQQLTQSGIAFQDDTSIPGVTRMYVNDPFGNRLEFLAERK